MGYPTPMDLGKQFGYDPFHGVREPAFGFARQSEKKAGNQVERIAAESPEHAQQLSFGAGIQSAPRLDLRGGGAVARHGFEVGTRPQLQTLPGGGAERVDRRIEVRRLYAGGRKGQVGVTVHKAGHDDASSGIDLNGAARLRKILHPPAGAHFHQDAVANEDGPILDYIEFIE